MHLRKELKWRENLASLLYAKLLHANLQIANLQIANLQIGNPQIVALLIGGPQIEVHALQCAKTIDAL